LEIGANGLILRDALMSAGGSREPGQIQGMVFNPAMVKQLEELDAAAQQVGRSKHNFERAAQMHKGNNLKALEFIVMQFALTEEQLKLPFVQQAVPLRAMIKNEEDVAAAIVIQLGKSFETKKLENLREFSRNVGKFKQDLVLLDNPDVAQAVVDKKADVERQLNQQEQERAAAMSELLEGRGSTSLRTLPQTTQLLVAVERRSVIPPTTYYFPYDFAAGGAASDIVLRAGDVVNVVDGRASGLMPESAAIGGGNAVAIQGYIENPAIAEGITALRQVPTFSESTIDDSRAVWTLVRPAPNGGSLKIFVFPDAAIDSNGSFGNAPTQAGDVYTHTILPQVPIIFESMLSGTMQAERLRCKERFHSKHQECKQECRTRWECVRDCISNACSVVPRPSLP
jgi:hypothetical protein